MTTRRDTPANEGIRASWADVIKASESHTASSANVAGSERSSKDRAISPSPGDVLVDEKFGTCTIHRISEGVIHMAKETGRVIRVRLDMLTIRPLGVETQGKHKHRRVFTTRTE